jgi:hypothetical protein
VSAAVKTAHVALRTLLALPLLTACLLAWSTAVRAELFCVSSPAELTGALTVSLLNGQQNEVRLVTGSYAMSSGWSNIGNAYNHALKLSGGWNGDCSSRVSLDPGSTSIHGQSHGASTWWLVANASVILDGFELVQSGGLHLTDSGCAPFGQEYLVRRMRIRNSIDATGSIASLFSDGACHKTIVENSLITGGALDGVEIWCQGSSMGSFRLVNNTLRDNVGDDLFASNDSLLCSANELGADSLHNNVVGDIRLLRSTPQAHHNIYASLASVGGGGFFGGSSNNLTVDPELDPINYRPVEPGSPAINSGTSDVPGGLAAIDLAGDPRAVGGIPDRGAYESSVVPPGPFILTVTSGTDSGAGSLREVIGQANASPGLNLVQFDLSTCNFQIQLTSPLPDITDDVIIDGYSQPGSSFNTLDNGNDSVICTSVVPQPGTDVPWAFRVPPGSAARLTVRGLRFGGFDDGGGLLGEAAIFLQGGSGHRIQGNHFGNPSANSEGVRLMNDAAEALIGGDSPALRNTFGKSALSAVHIIGTASQGHNIINNYIGTSPSGLSADGNLDGIRIIQSAGNRVLDNLISGNTRDAVYISGENATANVVAGNRIGGIRPGFFLPCGPSPLPPCPPPLTNRKGVFIDNDAGNNTIGDGGLDGAPNVIRLSTQHGIRVLSGQRNRLLGNQLYGNGSVASEYEIDLGSFGLDPIDPDCGAAADAKANRGQNRPVIESATLGTSDQSVAFSGELSSCTHDGGFSSVYRLQFFASGSCDANGAGPGRYFLGDLNVIMSGPVQTDTSVSFSAELEHPWLNLQGLNLTATATDLMGNTSELSECVQIADDGLFSDRFEQ